MSEPVKLTLAQQKVVDMLENGCTIKIHTSASSSPVIRYIVYNGQVPIKTIRSDVFYKIRHLLYRVEYHPLSETWKLREKQVEKPSMETK